VPRSSVWSAGAGIIASALAIGAIVTASAFAGFRPDSPTLSETPALPMLDHWQLDSLVEHANVTNLLAGPAHAVPSLDGPTNAARLDEEPIFSPPALSGSNQLSPAELSPEASSDPSLPGTRTLPYPGPATAPPLPYPNPTTTPPDAVAPPEASPQTPTPPLDPENPYRD
jgi:hypothetical protein